MTEFQGDMLISYTSGRFDISISNGLFDDCRSFDTAVILSWFGGNKEDDNTINTSKQWWGNYVNEKQEDEKIRSRTGALIRKIPLNSSTIKKIEDSAALDLEWMKTCGIADDIEIASEIPDANKLSLDVRVKKNGKDIYSNIYIVNWEAGTNGMGK